MNDLLHKNLIYKLLKLNNFEDIEITNEDYKNLKHVEVNIVKSEGSRLISFKEV